MKVKTRNLTELEINIIHSFIKFLNAYYHYIKSSKSPENLKRFYDEIKSDKYPYSKKIKSEILLYYKNKKHNEEALSKSRKASSALRKAQLNNAISLFSKGNLNFNLNVHELKSENVFIPDFNIGGADAFFSGGKRRGILSKFSINDIPSIVEKKYDNLRTSLSLTGSEDWEKIVFFIQHLSKNLEFEVENVKDYTKFAPEMKIVHDLIEDYQRTNKKTDIEEIVKLINNNPLFKEKNDSLILDIEKVYRGIKSEYPISKSDIEITDKKIKYVSTTRDLSLAHKFANSEYGKVITYSVNENSVLFSTELTGHVYGEDDIVIDASKAKIIDIDDYYNEEDDQYDGDY